MNLLFITEFFPTDNALQFTGGVESHNFYLFKELAKKHQVTVICRWGIGQSIQKNNWGMKIIRIGSKPNKIDTSISTIPNRLLFFFQSLIKGLSLDFDLVQGNNFVSYPSAFFIGFLKRKPTLAWYPDVFIGDWITLTGLISGLIGELTERISLALPWTRIISLSRSTTQKLIKQGVKSEQIDTIYGGVDVNFFSSIKAKKAKIFTICCISRLVNYKRVDLLIKAAAILKKSHINFNIKIIGEGPEDYTLKLLTQQLDLEDRIFFKSNLSRNELAKTLKQSHLFCLPSEQEGFGLVVMEAASCGLPYVVSDINVLKEITHNGVGGLHFKKGEVIDLASKINYLIKNKKIYQKLSKEVITLAKEYSWEGIAQQFEETYINTIHKPIKIIMLVDAWFPHVGGGQIHVLELARGLSQKGYQVTVLSRNLGNSKIKDENFKIVLLGKKRPFANAFGRIEFLILALIYCLRNNFDIYHAHAFSPGLLIPFIKLFKKGKTVFTVHGKGVKVAGTNLSLNFLEELVVYKIPYDLEISVAKSTIIKKTAAKNLIIIPNGVNLEIFSKAIQKRDVVRNILYVGRLSYEKGVDLLISAFQKLPQKLNLIIVGEGTELKKLKKLAKGKNIKFKGKLDSTELIREYKNADLLVLPSRTEGLPLTLFEAWAAKLPILVTNVGDNSRYIKDGENGFITQPKMEIIKVKIEAILNNRKLSEISDQGYKKVKNYSWEKITNLTDLAYKSII